VSLSIVSGTGGGNVAVVTPTAKSLRVASYSAQGRASPNEPLGSYLAPISMGRLATPAAGAFIWAIRNGPYTTMQIRRILANVGFDGIAAATTATYQFVRFSGATPTGGTIAKVIRKRTRDQQSRILDFRQGTAALTITSVDIEPAFFAVSYPRQLAGPSFSSQAEFTTPGQGYDQVEIGPMEGLAIRMLVAGIAGDSINGCVAWDEYLEGAA
jgi:hypothetical protein